ncbi:MAG: hypothetical protein KDA41_11805, partial [Planctomycetales bacterium]|nr:hypothetical protein [Planctomycetales bacterium]
GEVVDEPKRAEIYSIQKQFDAKLQALETRYAALAAEVKTLRQQIDGIKDQERKAVEDVLSAQQLAKIKKLQAEAQSRLAQELLKAAEEAAQRAAQLATPE